MGSEEHLKPPQTIEEVGIHIGYMREDMNEIKKLVQSMPSGFATKEEVTSLTLRVAKIEKRSDLKNTLQWVALAVTTIISLYGLFNMFGGK